MKPLPTLTVGLNCQVRSDSRGEAECPNTPIDSEEFKTYIIDNYLDLIDFAKADPETNKWGALRAKMGHPAPFELDRIGIGNEVRLSRTRPTVRIRNIAVVLVHVLEKIVEQILILQ